MKVPFCSLRQGAIALALITFSASAAFADTRVDPRSGQAPASRQVRSDTDVEHDNRTARADDPYGPYKGQPARMQVVAVSNESDWMGPEYISK
jgi:hypothetical protein